VLDDIGLCATEGWVAKNVAQDVECIGRGRHRFKADFLK
jgi:hypothetical protein